MSEFNRDQWAGFNAIRKAMEGLPPSELEGLAEKSGQYLDFRRSLDRYQSEHFGPFCHSACFETGLSACCGFESIFTFFADMVIESLFASSEEMRGIFRALEKPNLSRRCVYLGENGCIWRFRPISCAMFICEDATRASFKNRPEAKATWEEYRRREKEFTYPDKPVLFDDIEKYFKNLGVDSVHMYLHRSPGLMRLKQLSGLARKAPPRT